jgi:CTP:phosphocholine cytidylyltransferase-like protein
MNDKKKIIESKDISNLYNTSFNKTRKINSLIQNIREPIIRTTNARDYWETLTQKLKKNLTNEEKLNLIQYKHYPDNSYELGIYRRIDELNKL